MTKGAVTGAAPLNFLTPVPSATTCSAQCHSAWEGRPWPGLVDCGGFIIRFGIYMLYGLDKLVEKILFVHILCCKYVVHILYALSCDHPIHFIDLNRCTFAHIFSHADAKEGQS